MNNHNHKKENSESNLDSSWSKTEGDSGVGSQDNVSLATGILAEQIRMREELDRLMRENEELRRNQDTFFRLLSESASVTSGEPFKAAVRILLMEEREERGLEAANAVGRQLTLQELEPLKKTFATLTDSAKGLENRFTQVSGLTETLTKQVEEIAERQKDFGELKVRMDQINAQRTWVDSKLQSLSKQRVVVERANIEAGRLNSLFWEMEEKVREIGLQNKMIAKTTDHLEELENRLRSSHESLQRIDHFESVLKESRESVEEMSKLGDEFRSRLKEFQESQRTIDEASIRTKEAAAIVKSMEATMNTILQHNGQLEVTKKMIDGFQENLTGVDKKVEKIHKQWNTVEKLEGKIVKIEDRIKGFQQDLFAAAHLDDELKKVLQKVSDIRQGETELRRAMETLEAKRADLISINTLAEDARNQSDLVINNLEYLKHRQDEIGQVGEKVDSLNRFLGQTNNRIRDVEGKLTGFSDLETKMGKLESMIIETDVKIQDQIARQPAIVALRNRIDETEQLSKDLDTKTRDLMQFGDKVNNLEMRFGELKRIEQDVQGLYGRILEQKEMVSKQEAQFRELHETHRQLVLEFAEAQEKIGGENLEVLAQFASNKERLRSLQDEINLGLKDINGHYSTIKKAEERLKKVDGFLIVLEEHMGSLEKRQTAMASLNVRIQDTFKAVEDLEGRMALLRNEKSVIHDARKSVETLHVLIKSVGERIESLKAEEQMIVKTQESVKDIAGVMGEVEDKFKLLAQERLFIKDAQVQIQNLGLMVDDLKTQIKTVTEEEVKITDAVSKASELEFLIGEAESAIANLKRAKSKG
jgi:chromosome segregation ATPase